VSRCRVGARPDRPLDAPPLGGGRDRDDSNGVGAVGGDVRVPGLSRNDDCVQLTQDCRGDRGMGLRRAEPVVVAGWTAPALLET
jgi:hypothetical protein